jgi:hypothetical protein
MKIISKVKSCPTNLDGEDGTLMELVGCVFGLLSLFYFILGGTNRCPT